MLTILFYAALLTLILIGLLITPLGLPGNWLILACAIAYGFFSDWSKFGFGYVAFLAAIALAGEALEFLSASIGARKFGSSRGGEVAAFVGALAGMLVGTGIVPIIGSLIGAFAGAFLGAFLYEYHRLDDLRQSARAGMGAFFGRMVAIGLKELIGIAMVGTILYYIFAR